MQLDVQDRSFFWRVVRVEPKASVRAYIGIPESSGNAPDHGRFDVSLIVAPRHTAGRVHDHLVAREIINVVELVVQVFGDGAKNGFGVGISDDDILVREGT